MRRTVVLTDEAARHPFLASLPPHVRFVAAEGEEKDEDARSRWTMQDLREFLMAYCASFLAVSAFIF